MDLTQPKLRVLGHARHLRTPPNQGKVAAPAGGPSRPQRAAENTLNITAESLYAGVQIVRRRTVT